MNDTDRILGELKEFKRSAISKFDKLEERFDDLGEKVESLAHWRWKVSGGLAVMIAIAELVNVLLKH